MRYYDDIQFIHAAHLPACNAQIDRVFEDLNGVMLIFDGSIMLSLDHCPLREVKGPAVFWHEMGRHYKYYPVEEHWHHLWVSFHGTRGDRLIKEGFNTIDEQLHAAPLVEVDTAYKTMVELVKLVRNDLPRQHERAVHLLERMLLITHENQQMEATDTAARLMQLADRIREAPAVEYDFEVEAKQLELSYSHFRACFKKLLGVAPHQYTLNCRMNYAADLLQHERQSVTYIAHQLGYDDMAQFSKLFKSRFGYSPRQFRDLSIINT